MPLTDSGQARLHLGWRACPSPATRSPTSPGCPGWRSPTTNWTTSPPQLDEIISAVARVQEVAAEGIPPTSHAVPLTNVFRADELVPLPGPAGVCSPQAPAVEQQRFRVPRILAED